MDNSIIKEQKLTNILGYLCITAFTLAVTSVLIGVSPVANLTKEFGIPAAAASGLIWWLDKGATAATIAGIVAGFASGGLSLIAEAGKQSVKAYLKKQIKKKGKKAVIAW